MLLTLRSHFERLHKDDGGNVFISVVGLLALSSVIAMTIATSTTQAISQTTSTRAGVQAQAAADAGLAVAQVAYMQPGSCAAVGGVYQNWPGQPGYNADDPQYKVTVWRQTGGTWIQGCPLDTTTKVRLVSTGEAKNDAVGNLSANDKRYMEMVGNRTIQVDAGSALTFYSGSQMDSNIVASGTGSSATLQMINGNYTCTNGAVLDASVYVPNGNVTLTNSCRIKGSVYSSGTVHLDSNGRIEGDVYAVGKVDMQNYGQIDGNLFTDGAVEVNNNGLVKGSVEARGTASVTGSGRVNGSVWAEYISVISGRIDGSATSARYSADATVKTQITPGSTTDRRVGGSVVLGGTVDTWTVCNGQWNEAGYVCGLTTGTGSIAGTLTLHQAGQSIPTSKAQPAAKTWVDVPYDKSDWTDIGFNSTVLVWPSTFCEINNQNSVTPSNPNYAFWQSFKALTTPTIVDMRACSTMNFGNSAPASERLFKMKTDMLFLVKGFTAQNWTFDSNTTDIRRLYIITPDEVTSTPSKPHCSTSGMSWNGDKMTSLVRGFIYTPCNFYWGASANVNGQIYSGSYSQANSSETLTYYPVGIPGVDFSAGGSAGVPATFDIVGIQNRPNNGE